MSCLENNELFDKNITQQIILDKLDTLKSNYKHKFDIISQKGIIHKYTFLFQALPLLNITNQSNGFQTKFNYNFPKGNGVSNQFFVDFFDYLENNKNSKKTTSDIFFDFYPNYTLNPSIGRKDFRMGEISKLTHFISKGKRPIWSNGMREFFGLKHFSNRPNLTLQQMLFVECIFEEINKDSKKMNSSAYDFSQMFQDFRQHFGVSKNIYSDTKILDTMLWN